MAPRAAGTPSLRTGRRYDLFLSADVDYPRRLIEKGLADKQSELVYAIGHVVVWVPRDSKLDLDRLGMQALLDASVRKIAIANPEHAPYGRAALAALKSAGIYEQAEKRLVYGENVAQTAQFVQSGAADIGIISLSLALAPPMEDAGRFWNIPPDLYPPIKQSSVILSWAKDREATDTFRNYLTGPEAREVLRRFGFEVLKE